MINMGVRRTPQSLSRCAGALWEEAGGGRVAVVGSAEMFADAWLACEGNAALLAWLLAWAHPVLPSPPTRLRGT